MTGIISLVAVVTVTMIDRVGQGPAILIGLSVGLICGLINSGLILSSGALTQAESLFITFGMSLVFGAAALMYVEGVTQFLTYSETDISIFNTGRKNLPAEGQPGGDMRAERHGREDER